MNNKDKIKLIMDWGNLAETYLKSPQEIMLRQRLKQKAMPSKLKAVSE